MNVHDDDDDDDGDDAMMMVMMLDIERPHSSLGRGFFDAFSLHWILFVNWLILRISENNASTL